MALNQEELNALFAEVRDEWNQEEEVVKSAEQICSEAVFPSIKELRYAGRRLVDSFHEMANGNDEAAIRGYVKDAVFNCHCARHDAIDVATATIASNLELVVRKIGYDHVLKAFPEFVDLRDRLGRVRAQIRQSRSNRTERDEIYQAIHDVDLPALATLYEKFQSAEDVMKSLAGKERIGRLFLWITTGISVVVAVGSFLWAVFAPAACPTIALPPGTVITTLPESGQLTVPAGSAGAVTPTPEPSSSRP